MKRQDLLRPSTHTENSKLRLITNYNPNNPNLRAVIKKYDRLLLMTRKPAIKQEDIQVTYSRSPNIKDMIIKTEIYKQHRPKMCQPCYKPSAKPVYRWKPPTLLLTKPTTAIQSVGISTANPQI